MGWLSRFLGITAADAAKANCHGRQGMTAYQATLIPGDVNYQCNALLGGFLGLGWCRCSQ